MFGTPKDLKEFVQTAHDFGIAIIIDVVFNHFGGNDLDLWRFTSWNQNDKGGIYFYNDRRDFTPWGPRPDYGRGEVRQYIRDNVRMWLEEYRCDGLRFDATAFIRNIFGNNNDPANDIPDGWNLIQWLNDEINLRQPWKITIAEDIRNNEWITKDVVRGEQALTHNGQQSLSDRLEIYSSPPTTKIEICFLFGMQFIIAMAPMHLSESFILNLMMKLLVL